MQTIDAVAAVLKREGVSYLACFPTTPLIEACARVGIQPVISRQERVGVGIADGYSRVTEGQPPGVFAMQFGPGAENAYAGVATAYSDSSPILLLPLGHPEDRQGVSPLYDSLTGFASVTRLRGAHHLAGAHRGRPAPGVRRLASRSLRAGAGGDPGGRRPPGGAPARGSVPVPRTVSGGDPRDVGLRRAGPVRRRPARWCSPGRACSTPGRATCWWPSPSCSACR